MDKGEQQLINDIRQIVGISRQYAYRAVNLMQVISNWLIGQRIVEHEQNGCKFARHCLMNLQVCYSQSIRRCLTNFQPYGQRWRQPHYRHSALFGRIRDFSSGVVLCKNKKKNH